MAAVKKFNSSHTDIVHYSTLIAQSSISKASDCFLEIPIFFFLQEELFCRTVKAGNTFLLQVNTDGSYIKLFELIYF